MTVSQDLAPVLVEGPVDGVATVTLNRPDKRNALDLESRMAIAAAFTDLSSNREVRAVVLTGGDAVFAAGADLNMLADKGSQAMMELDLPQYWRPVTTFAKPLIAAVNGVALGAGCELAMMCDIIVADPEARFGQPEAAVGIMPGAGGVQRLVRLIGSKAASLVLLSGEALAAPRAYALGLVSVLAEPGEAQHRALEIARRIASMPPRAMSAIKRNLTAGADLPLDSALALENREFLLLFETADKTEGMRAFLERRKPQFTGD